MSLKGPQHQTATGEPLAQPLFQVDSVHAGRQLRVDIDVISFGFDEKRRPFELAGANLDARRTPLSVASPRESTNEASKVFVRTEKQRLRLESIQPARWSR